MTTLPHIPFSKTSLANLQKEEAALQAKRVEVLKRLQLAREMGDLSENGAYKAARFELGDTDRRLRQLQYLLRFGYLAPAPPPGIVSYGSQVLLELQGKEVKYQMVNQYESNPAKHKLSTESPLGRLLMGKKTGDKIELQLPDGAQTYLIKAIA